LNSFCRNPLKNLRLGNSAVNSGRPGKDFEPFRITRFLFRNSILGDEMRNETSWKPVTAIQGGGDAP